MTLRRLFLPVILALCLVANAGARTDRAQNAIAGGVAAELAKSGAKAAVAQFAPDLVKYTDPTAHGLSQIRDQLNVLDQKLTELKASQQAAEHHLNCVVQRTQLNEILSSAQVHLRALVDAGSIQDEGKRAAALTELGRSYLTLSTQQGHLHLAVTGSDGALLACARHLEQQQKPFLTSQLRPTVESFYAAYDAAAISLLTVRVNLINNGAASPSRADETIREVLGWIAQERALIRPALPSTDSYFIPDDLLLKTRVAPNGLQDFAANDLFKQGWYSSIRGAPGCSHLIRIADATGVPRDRQLSALISRNILMMPRFVYCYDDHHGLYAFDFQKFEYHSPGNVQTNYTRDIGTVMAHHAAGFMDVARYSYTLGSS